MDCGLRRRNEGLIVIGEFVDGRGVQFWSCRRESSCHMARQRLDFVLFPKRLQITISLNTHYSGSRDAY